MPYVSLYRKYRSQTFEDLMGQEHVTKTLQNAIRTGRVAHAYLFCGTRGTGKTTTARLLAKALNCESGPTPNPCNKCPACISITEGSAMDIAEMDAASHRSIRDIEEIRDNVKFPPMELRYKVFIIDEAHQLSSDAKDAFLKTLEEPPAHAIFVLATTEPQSIPITIRSRCQQFDFRRGSLADIRKRIKFVTDSEGVEVEDAALDLIALNADGSWRDALSLLEQVLAYTDGQLSAEDVHTILGTVTLEFLFRLADTLAAGDDKEAFSLAAEASESGRDIQQLLRSIAQHFRNLLFALVVKDLGNITSNKDTADLFRKQAAKFNKQSLIRMTEIFSEAERDIRYTDQHRLIFEMALLKAIEATANPKPSVQDQASTSVPSEKIPAKPKKPAPKIEDRPTQPHDISLTAPIKTQQSLPEFDKIKMKWNQVLQHIKSLDPPAHGLFKDVTPEGVRDGSLVLHFKYEGHINLVTGSGKTNTKRKTLLTAIERVFGVPNANIICEIGQHETDIQPADLDSPAEFGTSTQNLFQENNEVVSNVIDIFNGRIVDQ